MFRRLPEAAGDNIAFTIDGQSAQAFAGDTVFAASHQAGVLRLDSAAADPAWQAPEIGCGLPLRDAGRLLHPVKALASERPTRPSDRLAAHREAPEPAASSGRERLLLDQMALDHPMLSARIPMLDSVARAFDWEETKKSMVEKYADALPHLRALHAEVFSGIPHAELD